MFVSRKESSDIKIEIFSDMEVVSNESTRTVVIVFIVGRHLDLNKLINTVDLKHFSKIYFESIKSINTIYLIFKKQF